MQNGNTSSALTWDDQIRRLVRESGMSLLTFADATSLGKEEALRWWSGSDQSLRYKHLSSLSSFLGVAVDQLTSGTCPPTLVRRRLFEGPASLPEEFSEHASSFARTSAHIIEYLSMMYGRQFVDKILLSMNIHPLFFDNLDNRINLLFFIRFLNGLSDHGISDKEIESLACYLFLRIQDTEIGQSFARAKTYAESYSVLAEYVTQFESNFEYKFEIGPRKIRIRAKPTEARQFMDELDDQEYKRLFAYRKKAFGWFPLLSRLAPLTLNSPTCVLSGDSETVYECDYPVNEKGHVLNENQHLLLL